MATKNLAQATSVLPIDPPVVTVGGSANTVYTVPTGADSAAKLDPLVLSNTTVSALTAKVTVGGVQVGPTAIPIPAGDSVIVDEVKGTYGQGVAVVVTPSATGLTAKLTGLVFA